MTNASASEAPSFGGGIQSFPTTDAPGRPGAGHGRRSLVVGLVAVSLSAVTVGGVLYARTSSPASVVAPSSKLADGIAAYQQGGSVYTQQVPRQAATTEDSAFAPGGSVYDSQVPSAR